MELLIISAIFMWIIVGNFLIIRHFTSSFPVRLEDLPILIFCGVILGPVAFVLFLKFPISMGDKIIFNKRGK